MIATLTNEHKALVFEYSHDLTVVNRCYTRHARILR
jgi:hypothetical protein